MDIRRLSTLARRSWLAIGLVTLAVSGIQYVIAERLPSAYESKATVLVGPIAGTNEDRGIASAATLTYRDLARSDVIVKAAINILGLDTTSADLEDRLRVIGDTQTRFITIAVTDASPKGAASIATAIANQLQTYVAASGPQNAQVELIESGGPGILIGGTAALRAALMGSAALLIGILLAIVRVARWPIVSYPEDVQRLGLHILGDVNWEHNRIGNGDARIELRNAAILRKIVAPMFVVMRRQPVRALSVVAASSNDAARRAGEDITAAVQSWVGAATWLDTTTRPQNAKSGRLPVPAPQLMDIGWTPSRLRARVHRRLRTDAPSSAPIGLEILRSAIGDARCAVVSVASPVRSAEALLWISVAPTTILVAEKHRTTVAELVAAVDEITAVGGDVYGVLLADGNHPRSRARRLVDDIRVRVSTRPGYLPESAPKR